MREVDYLIEFAASRNSTITLVFQTHVHADYVSGGAELAKRTKSKLVFGPNVGVIAGTELIEAKDF